MLNNFFKRSNQDDSNEEFNYSIGFATFSLEGRFTFESIVRLCNKINENVIFGFAIEKGPVALIGSEITEESLIEFSDVAFYGAKQAIDYEFHRYSLNDAAQISNYFIYGFSKECFEKLKLTVKFDKIHYQLDKRKYDVLHIPDNAIIRMKGLLYGAYTPLQVDKMLKTQCFWNIKKSYEFALLNKTNLIAIAAFDEADIPKVFGFQDVWCEGEPEPPVQQIYFVEKKSALRIKDVSIPVYFFDLDYLFLTDTHPTLLKIDRTFENSYQFIDENGKDKRIIYD